MSTTPSDAASEAGGSVAAGAAPTTAAVRVGDPEVDTDVVEETPSQRAERAKKAQGLDWTGTSNVNQKWFAHFGKKVDIDTLAWVQSTKLEIRSVSF